ncbi:hypothetical protein PCE1_004615 [Barthelona sp. PCE]
MSEEPIIQAPQSEEPIAQAPQPQSEEAKTEVHTEESQPKAEATPAEATGVAATIEATPTEATETTEEPKKKKKKKKSKKKRDFDKNANKKKNSSQIQNKKQATKRLQVSYEIIEYTGNVEKGAKKDLSVPRPASYSPRFVEACWADWWEQSGFYKADNSTEKPSLVTCIPPPNVTGYLHLGHALTNTIEDALVRFYRMRGFETLWIPGTDHAGIATQTAVEKKLALEGTNRHEIGRENFIEKAWEWTREHGGQICNQLRMLGASLDWDREVFTMDEERSEAVKEAFVRMFEKKKVYRDNRMIKWDCTLQTAISDIEIDKIDIEDPIWLHVPGHPSDQKYEFGIIESFAYPVVGSDEKLIVATTRLETMLADSAVAIHPEDDRYKHLHGKFLQHPFHSELQIPIILDDELVDPEFGTGCVKVTPFHDENDFQCGIRHNLPLRCMLTPDGKINEEWGGEFAGMPRFEARRAMRTALEAKGLYFGKEKNAMQLGLCYRSKDILEPQPAPQWFVDCKDAAKRSVDAVRNGELRITPKLHENTWFRWLENIKDWCISRQLWWGHRIPAYYIHTTDASGNIIGEDVPGTHTEDGDRWVVARTEEEALEKAKERFGENIKMLQDNDVLDTWFSSGLFPLSSLGWPNKTKDLEKFFPTSILETGHDIIFFWVARMVMMSLDLTDMLPFTDIYLHSMVRDAHGRKMSKSLGNVVDPIDCIFGVTLDELQAKIAKNTNLDPREIVTAQEGQAADFPCGIPECGTDGLRLGLNIGAPRERDVAMDVNKVVIYRNFCNKMWNAVGMCFMYLTELDFDLGGFKIPDYSELDFIYQWAYTAFNTALKTVDQSLRDYRMSDAGVALTNFFTNEFCAIFLENIKPALKGEGERKQLACAILFDLTEKFLRMAHPFIPFITEELWQRLHLEIGIALPIETIMLADYPEVTEAHIVPEHMDTMNYILKLTTAVRSMRQANKIKTQQPLKGCIVSTDDIWADKQTIILSLLAEIAYFEEVSYTEEPIEGYTAASVSSSCHMYIDIRDYIDYDAEIAKNKKNLAKKLKFQESLAKKSTNERFLQNSPAQVIEKHFAKVAVCENDIEMMNNIIAELEAAKAAALQNKQEE